MKNVFSFKKLFKILNDHYFRMFPKIMHTIRIFNFNKLFTFEGSQTVAKKDYFFLTVRRLSTNKFENDINNFKKKEIQMLISTKTRF